MDVTNPRSPRYLAHIPGERGQGEGGGAQMARVCNGSDLPRADENKAYLLRSYGNSGHEIWDVTDPAKPSRMIIAAAAASRNTHKSLWECDTGIAYVVSGDPAWRTRRMTKIYDLSDPAKPVFIRDFGLPGQQPGSTGRRCRRSSTARSRSGRRATASTSATARRARASCRSSIARSC